MALDTSAMMKRHFNDRRRPKLSSTVLVPYVLMGFPFAPNNEVGQLSDVIYFLLNIELRGNSDTSAPVSTRNFVAFPDRIGRDGKYYSEFHTSQLWFSAVVSWLLWLIRTRLITSVCFVSIFGVRLTISFGCPIWGSPARPGPGSLMVVPLKSWLVVFIAMLSPIPASAEIRRLITIVVVLW